MSSASEVPSGPLKSVHRPWDYKNGWVRTPVREIICNNSLSKQARLLWIWLASLKEGSPDYTWADCEAELQCHTRSRRRCLGQLVSQGFIEFSDGILVIKDPYKAYQQALLSEDKHIVTCRAQIGDVEVSELEPMPKPETSASVSKGVRKPSSGIRSTEEKRKSCLHSWNAYKPSTYSSLRTCSNDNLQAIDIHMTNLNHNKKDMDGFIKTICNGIEKDNWWMNECNKRDFDAVFGSGKVQEKKRQNVRKFYELGLAVKYGELDEAEEKTKSSNNQDLDNLMYRLSVAKARRNQPEIDRWQTEIDKITQTIAIEGLPNVY